MNDPFDRSYALSETDLPQDRLAQHVSAWKQFESGDQLGRTVASVNQLLDAREIVLFTQPADEGSVFQSDSEWINTLIVVTDQRIFFASNSGVEAKHLRNLTGVTIKKTGTMYKKMHFKFAASEKVINVDDAFLYGHQPRSWNSLIEFVKSRSNGNWNQPLPLELSQSPASHQLEFEKIVPKLEEAPPITPVSAMVPSDSSEENIDDDGKAPGFIVALGCLIPLYVFGSFFASFFTHIGSHGLFGAMRNAFFQSHSPYFFAFLIAFFSLTASMASGRRRSYEKRGLEVPKSTAGIAIVAFLLAAVLGYQVDRLVGNPYAQYDDCVSEYLDTYWDADRSDAEYECSSYLP